MVRVLAVPEVPLRGPHSRRLRRGTDIFLARAYRFSGGGCRRFGTLKLYESYGLERLHARPRPSLYSEPLNDRGSSPSILLPCLGAQEPVNSGTTRFTRPASVAHLSSRAHQLIGGHTIPPSAGDSLPGHAPKAASCVVIIKIVACTCEMHCE